VSCLQRPGSSARVVPSLSKHFVTCWQIFCFISNDISVSHIKSLMPWAYSSLFTIFLAPSPSRPPSALAFPPLRLPLPKMREEHPGGGHAHRT